DVLLEEVLRDLDLDAGAVAGLAVGVDRAAMPHRLQRIDARDHHVATRRAVARGDETDAAGIVLQGGAGEALGSEAAHLRGLERYDAVHLAHRPYSAAMAAEACASNAAWMAVAASRPSRIAQTTSEAPRTISPAAQTPGRLVAPVRKAVFTV